MRYDTNALEVEKRYQWLLARKSFIFNRSHVWQFAQAEGPTHRAALAGLGNGSR
jgi:hypothetical protein